MSIIRTISEDITWVGALDNISPYFDQLMPLPQGTSYNAYLVRGSEKTALFDSVEPRFVNELMQNLAEAQVERLDYIISHHAEQDHSGGFTTLLKQYPEARIVTNEKCKHMLQKEHTIAEEKFIIIKDGETLSLGNKTIEFIFAPWVHWPETMFSYVQEDKVLFTCDLFGAHLAFDKTWAEREIVADAAKRYYAEIMMPFQLMVSKHLARVEALAPKIIAPSHGPIYNEPHIILDLYKEWTADHVEARSVIVYVSMHHSTERIAEHVEWKIKEQGGQAKRYDIMKTEIGTLITELLNTDTLIICNPTYLGGLHPQLVAFLFMINTLKVHLKHIAFFSSYGWQNNTGYEQVKQFLPMIKAAYLEPVYIEGYPEQADLAVIDGKVFELLEKQKA